MGEGHEVEIIEFIAASIEVDAGNAVKSSSKMAAAAFASSSARAVNTIMRLVK